MTEEGGEEGTDEGMGGAAADISGSCSFHRRRHWRPLLRLHRDSRRPLLGFFTAHGGAAPSHLQLRRPRPTTRCRVSTARDAACPGRRALAPLAGGLPLRAALTPPVAACPGGRCWLPLAVGQRRPGGVAGSRTKGGRQRDKQGKATRVREKEPSVYIPSY
jgi:hypothetical protein